MTWINEVPQSDRERDLLDALNYLDPDALSYEEWCQIGMALDAEGLSSHYDTWSQRGTKYKPGEPDRKIQSFKRTGITGNYIFHIAQQHGWINPGKGKKPSIVAPVTAKKETDEKEDVEIKRLRKILKAHNTEDVQITEPAQKWEDDLIVYIKTLFNKDDIITLTIDSEHDGTKWRPKGNGKSYKAGDLVNMISSFSVMEALNYNRDAGAWIRVNPMDGQGCSDSNVVDYRFTLVESDDLPILEQLRLVHELQLPVMTLTHSGLKSVHAVVRVDAENKAEYDERVRFIHDICKRYGLSIDTANKNPSRLTRLPGVVRGEGKQYLIGTHKGCSNYEEWQNMIRKGLFGIEVLNTALARPMPLKPELIKGILRQSHKMLISSSAKQGKTYLLMNLAIAIATGGEWLGFPCTKGKVLYLNLEIDSASAENRFRELLRSMGIKETPKDIEVMNLRGEVSPLDQLASRIIDLVESLNENYLCIILDPVYKTLIGLDENSNGDMAQMARSADLITEATGSALVYCHHFSKGKQHDKRAVDRASGAGVFSRDADALITLTAYDEETTYGDTVMECEFILREFRTPDNMMVKFEYPLFEVVSRSEYPGASMMKVGQTAEERADMYAKVRKAYAECNEVTSDTGEKGVHKKVLMDQIQKMYPDLVPGGLTPGQLRAKEKMLIEKNSELINVGRDGKNAVFRITSSSL